ncbi:MAG: hypothetical protein N3G21_11445, partial [Candidatus Hydrogenedentes bacterium]|nr:hypothetical protein [Candidatus Hydrogenedentota bacterium]
MRIAHWQIIFLLILSLHFLLMFIFYTIGIEPIYRHATPFYAILMPIYGSIHLSLMFPFAIFLILLVASTKHKITGKTCFIAIILTVYLLAIIISAKNYNLQRFIREIFLVIVSIFFVTITSKLTDPNIFKRKSSPPLVTIILLLAIHILLSLSIASLRNGAHSVAEPYTRTEYEYIGDIGITSNIYQLLNNYHELQPKLSLHAKLAPPGPLIILWALSYILGRTPLTLAIATIILGSTALISLYLWAKEISQKFSVNPVQISILYAVMPGILLFTSTSSEILYMPFLFITLFFFERALNSKSLILISLGGFSFAILSLLKFTLLSTAIYFFLSGIFSLFSRKQKFSSLILYGLIMSASFIGFYIALYFLTGYQPVKVFLQAH